MIPKLSKDKVKYWQSEIKSCEERQKKELLKKNHYPFLINYYEGNHIPKESMTDQNEQRLAVINEYFPNTNALISEIMYQNPEIILEATKDTTQINGQTVFIEENAPIMKGALEYGFKKLDALTENKLALFDMIYAGFCGVEVNYARQAEAQKPVQQQEGFLQRIKRSFSKDEVEKQVEQEVPKDQSYSQYSTYVKRWNPLHILFDWRAERFKDSRYLIKIIKMSYSEFVAQYPQYENEVKASDSIPYSMHDDEKHKRAVTLYEIQVKKKELYETYIVADNFYESIDEFERPYQTNGFNIKIGTLHEYGKLYPVSFAQVNKSIQDDINNYMTHMMEVAERNIPKRGYNKNKVKEDGLTPLNSKEVNASCPVDGGSENIWTIQPTSVSNENKELLQVFDRQKEKLWSVSNQRMGGKADVEFATELQIQEAGFQARQIDIQEGLRKLLREELDALKDIIVSFWDDPIFFKITGSPKPTWYRPEIDPLTGMVINPLTDILTADYEVDIDISTAMRPNIDRKKVELIKLLEMMTNPNMTVLLQSQGFTLNMDFIRRVVKDFGYNPELVLKELQPQIPLGMGQDGAEMPPGGLMPPPAIPIAQGAPIA